MTNESVEPKEPVSGFYWKAKYSILFVCIGFGTIVGCVAIGLYFGSQRQAAVDQAAIAASDKRVENTVRHYENLLGTQSAQHAQELLRYDQKFDLLAKAVTEQKTQLTASTAERRLETKRTQTLVKQAADQAASANRKADILGDNLKKSQQVLVAKVDAATSAVKASAAAAVSEPEVKPTSPTDTHWWQFKGH